MSEPAAPQCCCPHETWWRGRCSTCGFAGLRPQPTDLTERTNTMTTYRRFIETNEHEGETWNFWLQLDGNMTALDILGNHLDGLYEDFQEWDDCPFVLEDDQLEGNEVDLLVRYGDQGYMNQHNKIDGSLTLPKDFTETNLEAAAKYLSKGGIRKLFSTGGTK